jgi:hypothetical protein
MMAAATCSATQAARAVTRQRTREETAQMSRVIFDISMSVDGFVTAAGQTVPGEGLEVVRTRR